MTSIKTGFPPTKLIDSATFIWVWSKQLFDKSDLFIFDSKPALFFFEGFKQINPNAKFIYRFFDDLRSLKNHTVVVKIEE
ncbi:hypothetical protein RINTHH_18250 [Richelia intracellularis HH01]|uniref:Glucuronosyltransferase GumK N-terminal domain-containing protein n=1 Tax=Richelia intracellularis HH01 TaxID=1165094 RepID=M1X354_9NOST|nr:hypothetical protein [Richelia intracellularis]CCH67980.1 hypothetical protein RINTHH_18250 [Richelia intracellularis HH01]HAE05762.1 hypothetical protein [Richelia sp.]